MPGDCGNAPAAGQVFRYVKSTAENRSSAQDGKIFKVAEVAKAFMLSEVALLVCVQYELFLLPKQFVKYAIDGCWCPHNLEWDRGSGFILESADPTVTLLKQNHRQIWILHQDPFKCFGSKAKQEGLQHSSELQNSIDLMAQTCTQTARLFAALSSVFLGMRKNCPTAATAQFPFGSFWEPEVVNSVWLSAAHFGAFGESFLHFGASFVQKYVCLVAVSDHPLVFFFQLFSFVLKNLKMSSSFRKNLNLTISISLAVCRFRVLQKGCFLRQASWLQVIVRKTGHSRPEVPTSKRTWGENQWNMVNRRLFSLRVKKHLGYYVSISEAEANGSVSFMFVSM